MSTLRYFLRHAGDLDQAEKHQVNVLSWMSDRYGGDGQKNVNAIVNLGVTLKARGEFVELAPSKRRSSSL
jgi:hypothetical protein